MIKNIGTIQAILAINPDAQVTVHGDDYDTIEWNAGTAVISKAEIDAKIVELEAEWTANEYARNRATAYDSIGNQLDMIYKDNLNGTTTHKASVEAVKAKYPKP
tara:strand:+ start:115 stop:426 length:312 start_codon:yes stop_codon:yes gene_type:complete